jgi:integrase/recombinase XerC
MPLIRAHGLDQRRRGLEESTIDTRRRILGHLSEWLKPAGLLDASTEDIERFLDARRIGLKARYTYVSNLHSFYEWAVLTGHLEDDPTAAIRRPKVRPGLPRPISDNDLQLALSMAHGDLLVIVALAAYAGLRAIEIARLKREDVVDDRQSPLLIIHGKGNKPRPIPVHPAVTDALFAQPMPQSGPILRWEDGRALPAWKVSQLANDFLHGIGIEATLHQCRHWFGTQLYRTSGKDLLLVRDLMGHSSITTTTTYAQFDRAGASEAVMALRPGDNEAVNA